MNGMGETVSHGHPLFPRFSHARHNRDCQAHLPSLLSCNRWKTSDLERVVPSRSHVISLPFLGMPQAQLPFLSCCPFSPPQLLHVGHVNLATSPGPTWGSVGSSCLPQQQPQVVLVCGGVPPNIFDLGPVAETSCVTDPPGSWCTGDLPLPTYRLSDLFIRLYCRSRSSILWPCYHQPWRIHVPALALGG